ncbi:MAG TPA: hypothetical protein DCP40_03455 [Stenotrophomonas sp.]|nr:hypothetical protein [Stenotrophomonas sp.]
MQGPQPNGALDRLRQCPGVRSEERIAASYIVEEREITQLAGSFRRQFAGRVQVGLQGRLGMLGFALCLGLLKPFLALLGQGVERWMGNQLHVFSVLERRRYIASMGLACDGPNACALKVLTQSRSGRLGADAR